MFPIDSEMRPLSPSAQLIKETVELKAGAQCKVGLNCNEHSLYFLHTPVGKQTE